MRYFVTGGSGFIGSATIAELLAAGHQVTALARSDASAATVADLGAEVVRGELADLDVIRAAADASDGVAHLGFIHDFADFAASVATDRAVVDAVGDALAGSDRPFAIASGLAGFALGRPVTEDDRPDTAPPLGGRAATAEATLALAERGVRSSVVRLCPTVHGRDDHGFVPAIIGASREGGEVGFVGDGANRWPAVHRTDAAVLFRLALEQAPAGSTLHAVQDEGIPTRTIAEVIGRHLGVPAVSVSAEEAAGRYGFVGRVWAGDLGATAAKTRELLGWEPTGIGLLDDLEQGHYFA